MSSGMQRSLISRMQRLPTTVWLGAGAAVLFVLYFGFVELMEAREAARIAAERQEDPARYLDEVRTRHGLDAYIEALADVRDFDTWRDQAPTFLVGAWALVDADADTVGEDPGAHCLTGLVVEDGRLRYFGDRRDSFAARYRIEDTTILVDLADGGEITMRSPPDPWHPHQLEITLPGSEEPYYGFRCEVY